MDWKTLVKEYWDDAASWALTIFALLNDSYEWVPAGKMLIAVTLLNSVGVRVLKVRDNSAVAEAEQAVKLAHGAHTRINATELNSGILPMSADVAAQYAAARLHYHGLTNVPPETTFTTEPPTQGPTP